MAANEGSAEDRLARWSSSAATSSWRWSPRASRTPAWPASCWTLGCDYGQGFGYAPALSAQEAEVYLNESYVDGAAPVKARG